MNFSQRLRYRPGQQITDALAAETHGFDKERAAKLLPQLVERLGRLQYRLYAENRRALLVILQGMDAAGKDGTIRHVFAGINPAGCRVTSFKAPTALELAHDFLWRIHQAVPARGEIGVFNRSHYEDVLIARVRRLVPRAVWSRRYRQINDFEALLAAHDVQIVKCFLHISRDEQRERLQARLADPTKNWKFQPGDLEERKLWTQYRQAYRDALRRCHTPWAPWYVIPADKKWFRNLAVAGILVETLEKLDPQFPKPLPDIDRYRVE